MSSLSRAALVAALATAFGCSSGTPSAPDAATDAPAPDATVSCKGTASDTSWTALYCDFFGPGAKASCAGGSGLESNCHGRDDSAGTMVSKFKCGTTKDDCFVGTTSGAADMMGTVSGMTKLERTLRRDACKATPTAPECRQPYNNMPLTPGTVTFTDAELARIRAWVAAGSKND
jgi:hypothetical protein